MKQRIFYVTLVLAVLAAAASLLGIFNAEIYAQETDNWATQARGQDIGNLIGLVPLLVGVLLARKKTLTGRMIWAGSLMYYLYAYAIYSFALHFNHLFLVYTTIAGLSAYGLLHAFDHGAAVHFKPRQPFAAGTLVAVGVLFLLLWTKEVIPAVLSGGTPASLRDTGLFVNPVHVIDLAFVLPCMIATGVSLWKRRVMGSMYVLPWLVFSVLMGLSIVATMILMTVKGYENTVQPLVMVSLVVAASGAAAYKVATALSDN